LMYENGFKEYDVIPASVKKIRKNYTDTADTGSDYLCSINYIETDTANYVIDVLYTQKPMEFTEPKTAEMLTKDEIQEAIVESNNGGRSFARAVENQCRILGNNRTRIKWFHQSENKQVRIFTRSAEVQNLVHFPRGWQRMWPEFYRALTSYMKSGNNKNDDAQDCVTGIVEKRQKSSKQSLEGLF
jgi:predicted phage terminase large subunit-like protein